MKKFCISFLLILIIGLSAAAFYNKKEEPEEEYLRIHIRANSNSEEDQAVKYEIKELVVSYLTETVLSSRTKGELIEKIESSKSAVNGLIGAYLSQKGFDYGARTEIKNEEFPTRVYDDITLEAGYYDAVMIYLGEGKGDNWWCVVYPPLCFIEQKNPEYRSLIAEYIRKLKENR